ncbi:hypothetical protein [Nocardioides pakistanensis]
MKLLVPTTILTALVATGCAGPAPSAYDAAAEGAPAAEVILGRVDPAALHEVPAEVRDAIATTDSRTADAAWQPRTRSHQGRTWFTNRNLPPCGTGQDWEMPADVQAFDVAASLTERGRYVIARQVAVFGSVDAARAALDSMSAFTAPTCRVYAGSPVTQAHQSPYTDQNPAPVSRVTADAVLTAAGSLRTEIGRSAAWLGVVTRTGNAVTLTRVVDTRPRRAAVGPAADVDPALLREAAEQVSDLTGHLAVFAAPDAAEQ